MSSAVRGALLFGLSVLGGLACDTVVSEPVEVGQLEDQAQVMIAGLESWRDEGCVSCHCTDARGGCNLDAPSIQSVPYDLLVSRLSASSGTDHALKKVLPVQSMQEIDRFLDGLDEDTPLEEISPVARGYNLFASKNGCIECHLSRLDGTSQVGLGPALDQGITPDEIYYALTQDPCHPVQRTPPNEYPAECQSEQAPVAPSNPDEQVPATVSSEATVAEPGAVAALEQRTLKHGPKLPGPTPGVIFTNSFAQALTENPPPLVNDDRYALAQFLIFIGPSPEVLDPCAGEPPGTCTVDWAYIHVQHEVEPGAWNSTTPATN